MNALAAPPIRLRDEQEADLPFLEALYASTRQDELAQTGWSQQERDRFLSMQFHAQRAHYLEHFARDRFQIIVSGEEPIGRLIVGRWPKETRVIDIALLPAWRGRGIGGQLVREVLDDARLRNVPVRIHVETFNPAQRLYARLGFMPIEDKGVHQLMEWRDVR